MAWTGRVWQGTAGPGMAWTGRLWFGKATQFMGITMTAKRTPVAIAPASNGGAHAIAFEEPYVATVTITGACDLLFHAWNNEAVEAKSKAAKNSAAKKMDDLESYVYRNAEGYLCVPGEYLRMSIINAGRYMQDPRSPRKSCMDLFKAGITSLTQLSSLGVKDWDYEDRRRVVVQRSAVTRVRPAIREGYQAAFDLQINTPEYISDVLLREAITKAGRLVGIGDFRPTFGRFHLTGFSVAN